MVKPGVERENKSRETIQKTTVTEIEIEESDGWFTKQKPDGVAKIHL